MLPFLYQTRTLQRAFASHPAVSFVRHAHGPKLPRDFSIPFERTDDDSHDDLDSHVEVASTLTPAEAHVFKSIFQDIVEGRMPPPNKRGSRGSRAARASKTDSKGRSSASKPGDGMAQSIAEQARVADFRNNFLHRYPAFLREPARAALGMQERDEAQTKEQEAYESAKKAECNRVERLMKKCTTDVALWQVMEDDVFSLPERLGFVEGGMPRQTATGQGEDKANAKKAKKKKKAAASSLEAVENPLPTTTAPPAAEAAAKPRPAAQQQQTDEQRRMMSIHGALYPHFLTTGLSLLNTAFAHPSSLAFQILPRVKALGLPSYVLGVSTPLYAQLARMHWNRFGDANSALDMLREMNAAGLYADDDVKDLLAKMRDHLHGCTWGAQGPFVMAMMECSPYDGALSQRLDEMETYTKQSLRERRMEYAA